jgi:hypothetical protein
MSKKICRKNGEAEPMIVEGIFRIAVKWYLVHPEK